MLIWMLQTLPEVFRLMSLCFLDLLLISKLINMDVLRTECAECLCRIYWQCLCTYDCSRYTFWLSTPSLLNSLCRWKAYVLHGALSALEDLFTRDSERLEHPRILNDLITLKYIGGYLHPESAIHVMVITGFYGVWKPSIFYVCI